MTTRSSDGVFARLGRGSLFIATLTGALLGATTVSAQTGGDDEHRVVEQRVRLNGRSIERFVVTPAGAPAESADGPADGVCPTTFQYSSLVPFDAGGAVGLQMGMVEQEVAAISITLPASAFPVIFRSAETIFARQGNVFVETTTQWSVLVWSGTPNDGPLETYSSDGLIIPHAVIPPDNQPVGVIVGVIIDSGDPDQVVIEDDGSHTFSVGFRIDQHHQEATSSCVGGFIPAVCCPPPANMNAFLNTDTVQPVGANFPTKNWLRCRNNCGPLACPGGWHTLSSLGGQGPGGDWNIRVTYEPFICPEVLGACCIASSGTCQDQAQTACQSLGGTWQGASTSCATFVCFPIGACCLVDGSCTESLSPAACASAGGTFTSNGTTCAQANCPEPSGACCFEGECVFEDFTLAECEGINGLYQGNGTTCATISCNGACCLQPSGCLNLGQDECALIPNAQWTGGGATCATTICFPMGACCFIDGSCGENVAQAACTSSGGAFQGNGVLCSAVNCPLPTGACCLSTGGCINGLTQADCGQIAGSNWPGIATTCVDANMNGTADACEGPACPEDLSGNGAVDFADILAVIAAWGPCGAPCPEDLSGNGAVDFADILAVIAAWGSCP